MDFQCQHSASAFGAGMPDDLREALRRHRVELIRHLRIERACRLADRVSDALNVTYLRIREANRLSWVAQDLQDAGTAGLETSEVVAAILTQHLKELSAIATHMGGDYV